MSRNEELVCLDQRGEEHFQAGHVDAPDDMKGLVCLEVRPHSTTRRISRRAKARHAPVADVEEGGPERHGVGAARVDADLRRGAVGMVWGVWGEREGIGLKRTLNESGRGVDGTGCMGRNGRDRIKKGDRYDHERKRAQSKASITRYLVVIHGVYGEKGKRSD